MTADPARSFNRFVRLAMLGLVALASAGCGSIPQARFADYVGVYEEAREAGLQLYATVAPSLRAGGSGAGDAPAFATSLGPDSYNRSPCATRFPDLPSLQARCDLLHAVTGYHQVLSALNQGASAAGVRARLGEVAASLGSLTALAAIPQAAAVIGPAGALLAPLSGIIGEALDLADRVALKQALEGGAPTIHEAIAALAGDVSRIHSVQRAAYAERLTAIEGEVLDIINPALRIAGTRDRATDASARIARRALDERFEALFAAPEPAVGGRLSELPGSPAGQAMSAEELVAIGEALDAVAPELTRFHATVDEWDSFLEALHAYDDMLAGVDASLTALLAAANDPFALGGALAQLDGAIDAVRRDAGTIRQILAGL